jgi:hypothetical protein
MTGRPVGIKETKPRNTASRKQAENAAAQGITPLDILLVTMRETWDQAQQHLALAAEMDRPDLVLSEKSKAIPLRAYACQLAEKAAPYCHARLASTTINATVNRTIAELSADELLALAGADDGEDGDSAAPGSTH